MIARPPPALLIALMTAAPAAAESNLVIEAENMPAASIADEVMRRKRINFVYSNSRLGIGTDRPPKIEIYLSRPAQPARPTAASEQVPARSEDDRATPARPDPGEKRMGTAETGGAGDAVRSDLGGGADAVEADGTAERTMEPSRSTSRSMPDPPHPPSNAPWR